MAKNYENQSPYGDPELIRRVGILGDLWKPGMSDQAVNQLYEAAMNPDTPDEVIELLQAGVVLEQFDPESSQTQLDRNQI